jgi:drug/metabolite transporter (DMT)-like permease
LKLRFYVILVALAAIWGSSFMFARISVSEFGVLPLSAARSAIAALTLYAIMVMSGKAGQFWRHWKHFCVLGLISTGLPFTFITLSTQYSTAGFASILNALTPIMSAGVAWVWLREKLTLTMVTGICLSFIGVIFMITDTQSVSSELIFLPVLFGLLSSFFYGLTGNYSRKFMTGVPSIVLATGCQVFAALFMVPPALFLWPDTAISTAGWINATILGLLCTGLAFILYFHLLENIGVARTVIVTYLIPVFGMLWGFIFLDETITHSMIGGASLILSGIALTTGLVDSLRQRKAGMPVADEV